MVRAFQAAQEAVSTRDARGTGLKPMRREAAKETHG